MKPCDCCEGIESITPLSVANRPGLNTLVYRMGNHATFLETMKAHLSSLVLDDGTRPLKNFTARDDDDPAIAWLDGWATVADVLTFYQERIANEGYLRTATERRSLLELARLVGYKLRPGVAATVYLAFTVDNGYSITIPAGSRAQSIPGPGELPQPFETAAPLPARDVWNNLKPRQTRPQRITVNSPDPDDCNNEVTSIKTVYFQGISTNLQPNDPLLFDFGERVSPRLVLHRVESVMVQAAENRTQVFLQTALEAQRVAVSRLEIGRALVGLGGGPKSEMASRVQQTLSQLQTEMTVANTMGGIATAIDKALLAIQEEYKVAVDERYTRLAPWVGGVVETLTKLAAAESISEGQVARTAPVYGAATNGTVAETAVSALAPYLTALAKPASRPPANSLQLGRNISDTYAPDSDIAARLLRTLQPALADVLYQSWRNLPLTALPTLNLYTLRTRASVFAHNAPLEPIRERGIITDHKEWELQDGVMVDKGYNIRFTIEPAEDGAGWVLLAEIQTEFGGSGSERAEFADGETLFEVILENGDRVFIQISNVNQYQSPLFSFTLNCSFENRPIVIEVVGARADLQTEEDFDVKVSSIGEQPVIIQETDVTVSSDLGLDRTTVIITGQIQTRITDAREEPTVVWLDTTYGQIVPGSWVVLERPYAIGEPTSSPETIIARILAVSERSRAEYGITAKSTRLELDRPWIDPTLDDFRVIRETAVFAQSDLLTLAEVHIAEAVCGDAIELEGLYDGLEAGRWLIITGERTDIQADENNSGLPGITATELVMLAGVEQIFDKDLPGEKTHTRLLLAEALAYCYKRDTVTIYGNVAKASHGETRTEVLGSGDGSKAFQSFTLKQPPLTYLSDPNPSGIQSSLTVRVNDIKWHEVDNLTELGPNDREFITKTDNEDKTTVMFGDGRYGARLPTGTENVRAVYRNGIGKLGNVPAGQISLLATRPLGVKGVINPLRSSGGANRDSLDQARRNAPLAVMALDRLVSTQDYADFARTFGGIGKASAVELTDGRREVVHLTIAGVDDIPIDENSDLYRNLRQALHQFGDPYQPIQIDQRQRKLLIISAKVRILSDYLWEAVAPQIRVTLLDTFSFDRRELGQDVILSEVISTIQAVAGVAYVDVDVLDEVAETVDLTTLTELAKTLMLKPRIEAKMAEVDQKATDPDDHIQPAQLVYLSPDVPDTLILTEIT